MGRPKRTFGFLKCVQVINKNASTSFKAIFKHYPCKEILTTMFPACQVVSKNINSKSRKERFSFSVDWKLFLGLSNLRRIIQDLTVAILRLVTMHPPCFTLIFDFLVVLDIRLALSGVKKPSELMAGES